MKTNRIILLILVTLLVTGPAFSKSKVKNVIFLIGDGMGLNQMYAAMTYNNNELNIERCTYTGLSKTYSADNYITDSGAGGTALACGVKTRNNMVGMAPDSTKLKSILYTANENGLGTGVVVTCELTHATPASFVAHQPSRYKYEAIALDYLDADLDVFIGGGRKHFNKRKNDDRDLIKELQDKDYQICSDITELSSVKSGKLAGILYNENPGKASERKDMLQRSTRKALELLSQHKKGFFLMIEGSQIDWAGHNNDTDYLLGEMMDFDKTIGLVLDFAEKNGNTLVVITADHETGGMSIANGNMRVGEVMLKFTSGNHTGVPVPVYSFGPGAENFTGIFENTTFKEKFMNLLQLK